MGSSSSKFSIILDDGDDSSKIYSSGDDVSGKVVLELDHPLHLTDNESLSIRIKGLAEVHWSQPHSVIADHRSELSGHMVTEFKTERVPVNSSEDYFQENIDLQANHLYGLSTELGVGKHEYLFKFTLPPGLPPSFFGEYGQIYYKIDAKISANYKTWKKASKRFLVAGHLDLNDEPDTSELMGPVEIQMSDDNKNYFCICDCGGPISYNLELARKCFVIGEPIQFTVEIRNASDSLVSAFMSLWQKSTYHAEDLCKTSTQQMFQMVDSKRDITHGETRKWTNCTEIPLTIQPSRLPGCNIMEIDYWLTFNLTVRDSNVKFKPQKIPIVIGTIPMKSAADSEPQHENTTTTEN